MNLRHRIFRAIAQLDVRRPWTVIAVAAMLAVMSVLVTRARLQFRTGQDDLIRGNTRDARDYLRYSNEFPDLDGLVIVVATEPSAQRAEQFADTLAKRLRADPANVKSVFYKLDPGAMGNRALLYLDPGELRSMALRLRRNLPLLRAYAAQPTLAELFGIANQQIDRALAASGASAANGTGGGKHNHAGAGSSPSASAPAMDPGFFASLLSGMLADPSAKSLPPWRNLFPAAENSALRSFVTSDNGKYLLLNVAPGDGAADGPSPVQVIQNALDKVRAEFPEVRAGMTGGPALAYAERSATQHDMAVGSAIAIVGLLLLLAIPFRGVVEPLFAILALLAGVAWSFGFATLVVGHLNLLSAVFTSVLAGIGINFPIHLMARYDEARRQGHTMPEAVELAVVNTGTGVFASACIMALAFLMPMFTDFKGIAELGEISAAGLLLCLVSALFVFPALLAIRDRNRPCAPVRRLSLVAPRSTLERMFARPALIVSVSVVGTMGAAWLISGVKFDQNLLKLQASKAEAVRFENVLLRDSGRSSWFGVSLAPNLASAEERAAAFRRLPEVADVETVGTYIPAQQAQKRAMLKQLALVLDPITVDRSAPSSRPLRPVLGQLAAKLELLQRKDSSGVAGRIDGLLETAMARLTKDPTAFASYERRIAEALAKQLGALKGQLSPREISESNLPRVLRQRFIGKSGLYLVQIYPRGDVWSDRPLGRFVSALKTVDPDVTGPPVQTYAIATVMRQGYERAAVLALLAVFVFVFADFRNLRDTLLATVPLVFGGLWLLAAMGGLGWEFNLANLFAVPIIIGMGVDNGVNMLYRWREERDKSSLILTRAVGKSVTICSLTTIAAFAGLIPAEHHGISSLGWVMTLGVGLILLATVIVLPAMFELASSRGGDGGGEARVADSSARLEPPARRAVG